MGVAVQEIMASALMEPFSEDGNKKTRKPYTITKSRESWTEQEHDKFLEALQLFDRDWKKIEAFVGSKTVIQIRSHAQKYFLKVQKNGTREHVPPPRPKRKANHPYPQKASKNAYTLSQAATPFQASSCLLESEYTVASSSLSMLRSTSSSGTRSSWADGSIQPVTTSYTIKEFTEFSEDIGPPPACCSNTGSSPKTWQKSETDDRALPDFNRVYNFIGNIFDPSTGDHLQKLKEMDPIDVEAVVVLMRNISINLSSPDFEDDVVVLMRNISINLSSPDFEDDKKLLSSYNISG